eukprot:1027800-Rhodomonas_salina.2
MAPAGDTPRLEAREPLPLHPRLSRRLTSPPLPPSSFPSFPSNLPSSPPSFPCLSFPFFHPPLLPFLPPLVSSPFLSSVASSLHTGPGGAADLCKGSSVRKDRRLWAGVQAAVRGRAQADPLRHSQLHRPRGRFLTAFTALSRSLALALFQLQGLMLWYALRIWGSGAEAEEGGESRAQSTPAHPHSLFKARTETRQDRQRYVRVRTCVRVQILEGKDGHSFEVDTWSIGVVLYTCLVGKPPFETGPLPFPPSPFPPSSLFSLLSPRPLSSALCPSPLFPSPPLSSALLGRASRRRIAVRGACTL